MEWNFWAFEHHQQLGLVGVEPRKQTVEGYEACATGEDAIEPRLQGNLSAFAGSTAITFEIAVEPPDQRTDAALGVAVLVREGIELVYQTLSMDPA